MPKRVKLVSPGGTEIEVNADDTDYLKSKGFKVAGSKLATTKTKEVK